MAIHADIGEREVLPNGMVVYRHHRAPNATLESLRALSGIIHLEGTDPLPSWKFLEEEEPEPPLANSDGVPGDKDPTRVA